MSQDVYSSINPNTTSGTLLATLLNGFKDAFVSGYSGSSRPSEIAEGGMWVDTSVADTLILKMYDGTSDITLFTINTVTSAITLPNAANLFQITKTEDSEFGPILKLLKKRVSGGGQTLTDDVLGSVRAYGISDTAVEVLSAAVEAIATEDTTDAAYGSKLVFKATQDGSSNYREVGSIDGDGNLTIIGDLSAVDGVFSGNISGVELTLTDDVNAVNGVFSGNVNGVEATFTDDVNAVNGVFSGNVSGVEATFTDDVNAVNGVFSGNVSGVDGNLSGNVEIGGNLTVNGTTTTVNSDTLDVTDANITINNGGNQASADLAAAGLTVEMSDATDAKIGYDSTLASKWKAGESGAEEEVLTAGHTQSMSDKTISSSTLSGSSIENPTRLDPKKDTKANLDTYATTAENGEIVFATDELKMYKVADGALVLLGGSGTGSPTTLQFFTAENNNVEDLVKGNAADFNGGGTITASSLTEPSTPLYTGAETSFRYDPDADGSNDYFGVELLNVTGPEVDKAQKISINYKTENASDGDFRLAVAQYDNTDTIIGSIDYVDVSASTTVKQLQHSFFLKDNVSYIRYGFQNTSTTTTIAMNFDKFVVDSAFGDTTLYNLTEWKDLETTGIFTGFTPGVAIAHGKYRRVGNVVEGWIEGRFGATQTAGSALTITLPWGVDGSAFVSSVTKRISFGKVKIAISGSRFNGQLVRENTADGQTSFIITQDNVPSSIVADRTWGYNTIATISSGDGFRVEFSYPVKGWSAATEATVTEAEFNGHFVYYDGYTSKNVSNQVKFKTEKKDNNAGLIEVDNTGTFTKFTALKKVRVVVNAGGGGTSATSNMYARVYNSAGSTIYQNRMTNQTAFSNSVGINVILEPDEYIAITSDFDLSDNVSTSVALTAIPAVQSANIITPMSQSYTQPIALTWEDSGSTLPGNLGLSQLAVIGDYIYLFGGYNGSSYTNVIYRAPVSNPTSWSDTGSTLPGDLTASQLAIIGDYVYLFGGNNGSSVVSVIYRAPVSNPTNWSDTGSTLPGNLGASQLAIIGDYVYLFGGDNGSSVVSVIYRAPVSDPTSWSDTGSTLPGDSTNSQLAVIGDYVYLFGGYNGSSYTNVIYRAPVSNPTSWSDTGSTLPGNLGVSQLTVIGDYIYLFGGRNVSPDIRVVYRAPVSNPTNWSDTGSTLPGDLAYSQLAVIGDYVYLFGGYNGSSYTNVIYKTTSTREISIIKNSGDYKADFGLTSDGVNTSVSAFEKTKFKNWHTDYAKSY